MPVVLAFSLAWVAAWQSNNGYADDEPSDTQDDASASESPVRLSVIAGREQRHVAGRWSTVVVSGLNRTDTDVDETITLYVGEEPGLEYARRVWVPANARRLTWLPIQIPGNVSTQQSHVTMSAMHLEGSQNGDEESNLRGTPVRKQSLLVSWEPARTGMFLDQISLDPAGDADSEAELEQRRASLRDLIYAGHDSVVISGQDLGIVEYYRSFLPTFSQGLESVDQLVIAGDQILQDSTVPTKLRRWLEAGGRLWIMVDQLAPTSIDRLLGDVVRYTEVDRVELNEFDVEIVAADVSAATASYHGWSSETPVEMVRVITESCDVHCRVNGWPVAFSTQVGHGELFFTTIEPRAWLDDTPNALEATPTDPYKSLSSLMFTRRVDAMDRTADLIPFVQKEIGYRVAGFPVVGAVLAIHMLLTAVIGIWLARQRKAHLLAYIVPTLAVVAAVALALIGKSNSSSIPSTVATGQIIRFASDGSESAHVQGLSSIYSQADDTLQIESENNATSVISDAALGDMKRVVWFDDGQSEWKRVKQSRGTIRQVSVNATTTLPRPWIAKGKFTEKGFEGELAGMEDRSCEDGIIATAAAPAITATFAEQDSQHHFIANADGVLPPGEFIDVSLMSDVQRRRQELLRKIIVEDPVAKCASEDRIDERREFRAPQHPRRLGRSVKRQRGRECGCR